MSDALFMDVMTGPPKVRKAGKTHYSRAGMFWFPLCEEPAVYVTTSSKWTSVTCKRCLRKRGQSSTRNQS
jgi:hypothetical protein